MPVSLLLMNTLASLFVNLFAELSICNRTVYFFFKTCTKNLRTNIVITFLSLKKMFQFDNVSFVTTEIQVI